MAALGGRYLTFSSVLAMPILWPQLSAAARPGDTQMSETLPAPVRRYFDGKNAGDPEAAVAQFAASAVVSGENALHEGPAAIRAWIEDTTARYADRTVVRSFAREGDEVAVDADVSGTFPGSPVTLTFRFTLDGDRIARLEIG